MQLKLPALKAIDTTFLKMTTLEKYIKESVVQCENIEEEIAELETELARERSYLSELKDGLDEADKRLEQLEAIDNLSNWAMRQWLECGTVLYKDVLMIEDGMSYFEQPYTLTRDRWEIETTCGGDIPNGVGFGLIRYENYIPIVVWGGQGFPHPDSPLQLLYFNQLV